MTGQFRIVAERSPDWDDEEVKRRLASAYVGILSYRPNRVRVDGSSVVPEQSVAVAMPTDEAEAQQHPRGSEMRRATKARGT